MIVTTRVLLNYIRCFRFAALDKNAIGPEKQAFDKDYYNSPIDYSLNDFENFTEIYSTSQTEEQLFWQIFGQASKKIQGLVKTRIPSINNDLIKADLTYKYNFNKDMTLEAKPDFLVDALGERTIFLVHASSGKKLLGPAYTINKRKHSYFSLDKNKVYIFNNETPNQKHSGDYGKHMQKLTSRHEETGRVLYDAAYQSFVLGKCFPKDNLKTVVVMLNQDFIMNSQELSAECLSLFDVTHLMETMASTIETDLYRMINHMKLNDDSRCQLVKNECNRNTSFQCPYLEFCFSHIPKHNSVFDYFQQHLGFKEGPFKTDPIHDTYDLVNEGIVDMQDVPISWLQRETNLMQRYCVENDYTFINKQKIKDKLATLVYPLYYLDFEAYPSVLPRFPDEKCYTQSVFQFSVHVQSDEMTKIEAMEHCEFIMKDELDHREELVIALLEAIPEGKSSVVVYNQTFENNRLQELAMLFPKYAKRLNNLRNRLFDLLKVVKNDYLFYLKKGYSKAEAQTYNFYHPDLCGSYSLKKVLPVLAKDDYSVLSINNGMMAYLQFARTPTVSENEKARIFDDLLKYCGQDTRAMAVILDKIRKMIL